MTGASAREVYGRADSLLADAVEGNLGSASALARFFVGLVDAAEEKENFGSASALARFFMGVASLSRPPAASTSQS